MTINPTQRLTPTGRRAITRSRSRVRTRINRLSLAFTIEFCIRQSPNILPQGPPWQAIGGQTSTKVDLLKLLPLIKPSFEYYCSVHIFHKCVLNNGMQYHNTISFKMLAYHSSMNYNISKQEQYASCINNHLLVVQNK